MHKQRPASVDYRRHAGHLHVFRVPQAGIQEPCREYRIRHGIGFVAVVLCAPGDEVRSGAAAWEPRMVPAAKVPFVECDLDATFESARLQKGDGIEILPKQHPVEAHGRCSEIGRYRARLKPV